MNWYKKAQITTSENPEPRKIKGYPYYLAVYKDNKFKGQYPSGIKGVKELEKRWDKGEFGLSQMKQIKSEDIQQLIYQLKFRNVDPQWGNVDYYIVRRPNAPREKLNWLQINSLKLNPEEPLKDSTAPSFSTAPSSGVSGEATVTPRQLYTNDKAIQEREDLAPSQLNKKPSKRSMPY